MPLMRFISRNWFLVGILLVIILARTAPGIGAKDGPLKPELTVKYLAVSIIFFNSGLSLKTEIIDDVLSTESGRSAQELTGTIFHLKLHLFAQCFTFLLFPIIIQVLVSLLDTSPLDKLLLEGLVVLSCMPPPVSSAVILTKAAGGNVAAAIFNSVVGSFLGMFLTPSLLLMLLGSFTTIPVGSVVLQLSATVVLPLVVGQLVRLNTKHLFERKTIPFGEIGSGILLLIIYTTFCDTFSHDNVTVDELSLFIILCLVMMHNCDANNAVDGLPDRRALVENPAAGLSVAADIRMEVIILQMFLLLLVFYLSGFCLFDLSPADCVALLFCCTHKSLTLGIPIIKIVFSNYDGASIMSIPLLIYHPIQILLGGLLIPLASGWLVATQKFRLQRGIFIILLAGCCFRTLKGQARVTSMTKTQSSSVLCDWKQEIIAQYS